MKPDIKRLRRLAKRDFELAWQEGGKLVEREGRSFEPVAKGRSHPLYDLIQRVRQALIELGFAEIPVPMIVDKREVYRQYGEEAPIILDRVFFLAGLDRPDIGIGRKKLEQISVIVPGFGRVGELQSIFRRYKLGQIEADDLLETIVRETGVTEGQAGQILSLFEELHQLKPIPTDLTLRSHTTSLWFEILQLMRFREPLPIQLFSVGPKFRREQRLDESHLYESWTASLVVMAERFTLEDGQEITRRVFEKLGHKGEIKMKKVTSRYYAPETEFEVFLTHPRTGKPLEVGDGGLYSPVALANYDIPYPVFNLGIGIERLLMVETGETDVRVLVYPYRYQELELTDKQLAGLVRIAEEPVTETGRQIAEGIARTAEQHADAPSPCEFEAFRGELEGKKVRVRVVEPEKNTRLVGPAGFNEIRVYDGNVVAMPPREWKDDEFLRAVRERGVSTGIRFIDAFAAKAAAEIERAARSGEKHVQVRVRNVKQPSDINLEMDEVAQRFITSRQKRIDVRGPVFVTVEAGFE